MAAVQSFQTIIPSVFYTDILHIQHPQRGHRNLELLKAYLNPWFMVRNDLKLRSCLIRIDLQVRATYALQFEVIKTYVFSTKNCTFAKSGPSTTTIIVSIVSSDSNVRIRILALDSEDQFHELGNIELPVKAKHPTVLARLARRVTVPPKSALANALGRAAATSKWLASSSVPDDMQDVEKTKLLDEMRTAIDRNLPENADNAFSEWEKRTFPEEMSPKDKLPDATPVYGYNSTKEVLNIVTQPTNPHKAVYSSKIVQHLLEKKAISTGLLDIGILPVLLRRNDWNSISLALTRVPDLREVEIVECLCFVLARHRHALRTTSLDAMQVDTTPDLNDSTPSLSTFFNLILRYNFSPIPLRAALRRYLSSLISILRFGTSIKRSNFVGL
ncbi:hypothetical protein FB446DRAFT_797702 [Lentinula raphanica]|nr:hypothetical protein FB446DRAFT_797702 [Lentinula raphanica]